MQYATIVRREIIRVLRIWLQTLIPPAITMSLYFIIFGRLIGSRIGSMAGFSYMDFIVPGLIMMSVITNSYGNVVSSFFSTKFQRSVEEMLVAPLSEAVIIAGFVSGGVFRGLLNGAIVIAISLVFTRLPVQSPALLVLIIVLTSVLFSLAGFCNAMLAKKFDDVSIIPTFVLTPLSYLGGVFYSIQMLPEFWQLVSRANPILYMVNAFRFGFLGVSDVPLSVSIAMILLFIVLLFGLNLVLLKKGYGIRS
ncbi:MAG: ABC transporter permease [Leptospiraceae bacterium]|nr:ABC transporter permease [Leptospiraceae bacterium]